jgi:hypothetical protein
VTSVPAPETGSGAAHAGHNRIGAQALANTARAVAAETFGVPAARVRADFSDDSGSLALHLTLPMPIPLLQAVVQDPSVVQAAGGTVLERVRDARGAVLQRVASLSGAQLSRVDIRVTGVAHEGRTLR